MIRGNSDKDEMDRQTMWDFAQTLSHTHSLLPWAGLMRELDTVGVNLQDLHYVWVVGTHHMESHLHGRESNTV